MELNLYALYAFAAYIETNLACLFPSISAVRLRHPQSKDAPRRGDSNQLNTAHSKVKVKVSSPYNRPRRPKGGIEEYLYSFLNLGARWMSVVNITLRPLYPPGKTRFSLYRRLSGPQGVKNLDPHRNSIPVPSTP